jgi:surfactin synthase thioesterase subunit
MTGELPVNRRGSCPTPNPGAAMLLFCFPCASGDSLIYRQWAEHLPLTVEVCVLVFLGWEARRRERPYTLLPLLIESLAKVLLPRLEKLFDFFGHSMRALIGFELIRELGKNCGLVAAHLSRPARHMLIRSRRLNALSASSAGFSIMTRLASILGRGANGPMPLISLRMLTGGHFFLRKFQPLPLSLLAQRLHQLMRMAS